MVEQLVKSYPIHAQYIVKLIGFFVYVAMPHILYKGVKGHTFQIISNAEYISWHLVCSTLFTYGKY